MSVVFQVRGSAQIGWMHASSPLAKLSASATGISVSCPILGHYTFTPEEVIALEPAGSFLARGIRIVHSRLDYPASVVFGAWDPRRLVGDILHTGFQPRSQPLGARHWMPVRWNAVALVVAIWNGLCALNYLDPRYGDRMDGPLVFVALAFMFCVAFALQRFPLVQSWMMRPGRSPGEIRPILNLIQVVTGLMMVFFGFFNSVDRFPQR